MVSASMASLNGQTPACNSGPVNQGPVRYRKLTWLSGIDDEYQDAVEYLSSTSSVQQVTAARRAAPLRL